MTPVTRALAILATTALLVLGPAVSASAHVRVSGTDVSRGGYGVLTFRVPTESATTSTTRLRVSFPAQTPIASVSTQPVPGWTAKVTTAKPEQPISTDDGPLDAYVSSVTWTANSASSAIGPGEFQQFAVSAGPLPDAPSVTFPATQTYSDGTVVNWNERSADGTTEPEHPAPVLDLPAAGASGTDADDSHADDSDAGSMAGMDMSADVGTDTGMGGMDMSDSTSSWPGWVGLGAGIVALLVAVAAYGRAGARRPEQD